MRPGCGWDAAGIAQLEIQTSRIIGLTERIAGRSNPGFGSHLDARFGREYCAFMLAEKLSSPVYYLMISVMLLNLFQRKQIKNGEKKRFATLWLAAALLLLQIELGLLISQNQPDWMLLPAFALFGGMLYLVRNRIFIFRRKCVNCGENLGTKEFIGRDDNLCAACAPSENENSAGEPPAPVSPVPMVIDEENRHTLGKGTPRDDIPRSVEEIDWDGWDFAEKAVLCYLFRDDEVLLIHKKTGLGKGKVNAPGGRIEAYEMPADAAVREVREETGISPKGLTEVARLHFIFTDGYSLKGTVFFARDHEGTAVSTEEADPFWVPVKEIPYDQMWEDDKLWLPLALAGSHITGRFIFEDEKMISREIIEASR